MDFTEPNTVRSALQGIRTVFLVAPPVPNLADLEGDVVRERQQAGGTQS